MPIPSMTTNLPNGVVNEPDATQATMGSYVAPNPGRTHEWHNDFDDYSASEWVISTTGSSTPAVQNADGGILAIANSGGATDATFFQWSGLTNASVVETFAWEATQALWFHARCKMSSAATSQFVMGLQITDTTPLGTSDELAFHKDNASASLYFTAIKSSTVTSLTGLGTILDDTYFTVGFWWDPNLGVLTCYFNGNPTGSTTTTTNFPTRTLAISFGLQNGDANARTLSVDYITVAKDRRTNFS